METVVKGLALLMFGVSLPVTQAQTVSVASVDEDEDRLAASHKRMVELLREIDEASDRANIYLGEAGAREARAVLASLPDSAPPKRRWKQLCLVAFHEMRLGNPAQAIVHFAAARDLLPELGSEIPGKEVTQSLVDLATAHMRLGENQNCVAHHTSDSCVIPIRGSGVYIDQEGPRAAIEILEELLDRKPRHVVAKWLLNLAYQTVGEWPDQVPEAYLAPEGVFTSDEEFPRFVDIAPGLGLNTFNNCGGAIADDFDADGLYDILASTWHSGDPLRFFKNNGDGTFTDRTVEAGLSELLGGLNLLQADYDNDGDLDVFVLRGAWLRERGRHPNSLLRNDGTGKFIDVTFYAGLGDVHYPTQTASWGDYDNDGDLDLYVGNENSPAIRAASQLFENNGDGTFVDVAERAGVQNFHFAKAVHWGDYDGDRYLDLYVSNEGEPNRLYHNNGDGTFADVASKLGVSGPLKSFPAWFWDFDNDGCLDIYVTSNCWTARPVAASYFKAATKEEVNCLYRGDGAGGFEDVAEQMGLTLINLPMGSNFGDIDNDGFLDFYLGTGYPQFDGLMPNVMYWNRGGKRFADVTVPSGLGHLQKGHAVAFADFDRDGDQDIFMQMGGAFPGDAFGDALFENPGFGNHWIQVRLVGTKSNRSGMGARIHCRITEGEVSRSVYRHVNSGATFGGNPLTQMIGLGQAEKIDLLEVYWPTSDVTQTLRDVAADQLIEITEKIPAVIEASAPAPTKPADKAGTAEHRGDL
ncbi:MAG: hypothetical protein ACI8QZ_000539 [Chlamydiales bacterium]|jgi:hypothetical protein